MQRHRSSQLGIYGVSWFFLLLLVCILIAPAGLAANEGISYYGGAWVTVLPYTLGFLLAAVFAWRAAQSIDGTTRAHRWMSLSLRFIAACLIGLCLTPYDLLGTIHTTIGTTLFAFQLVLTIWLSLALMPDIINFSLVGIELLAGIAAFIYLPKPQGFLLQSQAIFQIAAWLIVIRVLDNLGQTSLADKATK